MISVEEARAYVLDRVHPLPAVTMASADAVGCVVAEPVVAGEPVPPFPNSAMDGFAVRAANTTGAPVELDVVATLAAGADPSGVTVNAGQAVRIMTGAAMPTGADAIVMVERTTELDDASKVRVEQAANPGDHVRATGDDIQAGDVVMPAGTVLTPAHIGVLASLGVQSVVCGRRPRVGVLSTGDELIEGPSPLKPGQIRDSNRHALLPLVRGAGCEAVDLGLIGDDEGAITAAIEMATSDCDALLTSGGVSMGDFDFVKVVLDRLGDMRWMQVAIKPAKPFAFGVVGDGDGDGRIPVFGLPGNPVSSLVSFELFARPALRRMLGYRDEAIDRMRVRAVADDGLRRRPDGKVHFVRVVVETDPAEGRLHARSAGGQGSHQLVAMAAANALAVVPDGDGIEPGGSVDILVLDDVSARPSGFGRETAL